MENKQDDTQAVEDGAPALSPVIHFDFNGSTGDEVPTPTDIQLPLCVIQFKDLGKAATQCVPAIIDAALRLVTSEQYPGYDGPYNNNFTDQRTTPVTDADAWSVPNLIIGWNVWGLAPINLVLDPNEGGVEALNCDLMGIFWDKPFKNREFVDEQLKTAAAPNIFNEPTFFALSGFQEAFNYGPDTCQWATYTRDEFIDLQDRLFRAEDKRTVNARKLFDGWKWMIGTSIANKVYFPQWDGKQAATGSGLCIMSTHEPYAFGYQDFPKDALTPQNPDLLSLKGIIWGFYKNQDSSKGVLAMVTHFFQWKPWDAIMNQFDTLMVELCNQFCGEVGELLVYAWGDWNTEPSGTKPEEGPEWKSVQELSPLLASMSYLTDGSGPTVQDGGTLDQIYGGKYLGDGQFGTLDTAYGVGNVGDGTWTVGGETEPNYYTSLSDHHMVWATTDIPQS